MFRKVLFPTDFSEASRRALERFGKEAGKIGELVLLHVVDEGYIEDMEEGYSLFYMDEGVEIKTIEEKAMKKAEELLKKEEKNAYETIDTENIRSVTHIGVPYETIVETAEKEDVSLILLPSHGKMGYSHELFGSTTIRVLRKTKKPVLIIKTHGV